MFTIESFARIDEMAHITGIALIPRISRNDNAYTKGELKRFDNVTVPLNWEHDRSIEIGKVTFHYNKELEQVFYDGYVTDDIYANKVRNQTLFTSIEADPVSSREICNGPNDCFNMPFGLVPQALALTASPGIPETSVSVIESMIKENYKTAPCNKKIKEDVVDTPQDIPLSKKDTNTILLELLMEEIKQLESKIQMKYEILKLYEEVINKGLTDQAVLDSYDMCKSDLLYMGEHLMSLRKSMALVGTKESFEEILKEIISFEKVDILSKLKEKYICPICSGIRR